tara:strand:- start:1017 stop:1376 length:360 start_codon:yes stop_codon:yes gene_type:complete
MRRLFGATLIVFALLAVPAAAAKRTIALTQEDNGVSFFAMSEDPSKTYDTSLLPGGEALRRLIVALDRLTSKSPISKRSLNRLKKTGKVVLVYLPGDIGSDRSDGLSLAAFLPDFLGDV